MTIVELNDISKVYTRQTALSSVNLTIDEGSIFGLLGPNGAGKTSIISILLGLTRQSSGNFSLFGEKISDENLPSFLTQVGAVFERPVFYPQFSASFNLRLLGGVAATAGRILEVSELVGLRSRIDDKVGVYSMGMRQRLAFALAVINKPKLLVLDEPTNGLDPLGIADLRRMVRSIQASGTTVLLASHLLTEVEKICTDIAILDKGQVVTKGSMLELLPEKGSSLEDLFLSLLGNKEERC